MHEKEIELSRNEDHMTLKYLILTQTYYYQIHLRQPVKHYPDWMNIIQQLQNWIQTITISPYQRLGILALFLLI